MHSTPPSLLQQLRTAPDAVAWGEFVELYTPLLYQWTRRVGLDENDARDLIQDVFVVLVEKLPEFQYDPTRSFRSWLKTLLLNRWRNQVRRAARHEDSPDQIEAAESPDAFADIDEREYSDFVIGRAMELMRTEFSEPVWRACWMCTGEGRQPAEVARELGMSVNSVYAAKCRVLLRLRQKLTGLL